MFPKKKSCFQGFLRKKLTIQMGWIQLFPPTESTPTVEPNWIRWGSWASQGFVGLERFEVGTVEATGRWGSNLGESQVGWLGGQIVIFTCENTGVWVSEKKGGENLVDENGGEFSESYMTHGFLSYQFSKFFQNRLKTRAILILHLRVRHGWLISLLARVKVLQHFGRKEKNLKKNICFNTPFSPTWNPKMEVWKMVDSFSNRWFSGSIVKFRGSNIQSSTNWAWTGIFCWLKSPSRPTPSCWPKRQHPFVRCLFWKHFRQLA